MSERPAEMSDMNAWLKAAVPAPPRIRRNTRPVRLNAVLSALCALAWSLAGAACSGTAAPDHSHGAVIGQLAIPFNPPDADGSADVITVTVAAGQRFSVKVDTSDGPFYWSQQGPAPDPQVMKFVGDFNQGSCPANVVGCRVPFFHTLLARGHGMATMTWKYHALDCPSKPPASSQAAGNCPKVTIVTFDVTVR
jgi:hypothetical protein